MSEKNLNIESRPTSYESDGTTYIGQTSLLPKGEVCLSELLQGVANGSVELSKVQHSQNVRSLPDTHGTKAWEVACGFDGCSESVTVHTTASEDGREVLESFENPRVSKLFAGCEQRLQRRISLIESTEPDS